MALCQIVVVWQSSKAVFLRALDGVEPNIADSLRHAAGHTARARWLEHRLHAELNVAVASRLSVGQAHVIAKDVQHTLLHHLAYLSSVIVHIDPSEEPGEAYHRIVEHSHDGLPLHSH